MDLGRTPRSHTRIEADSPNNIKPAMPHGFEVGFWYIIFWLFGFFAGYHLRAFLESF